MDITFYTFKCHGMPKIGNLLALITMAIFGSSPNRYGFNQNNGLTFTLCIHAYESVYTNVMFLLNGRNPVFCLYFALNVLVVVILCICHFFVCDYVTSTPHCRACRKCMKCSHNTQCKIGKTLVGNFLFRSFRCLNHIFLNFYRSTRHTKNIVQTHQNWIINSVV